MKMAEAILKYLKANDVDCIFGIPAGIIGPLYDSLIEADIKPVITKNEAGAAYMAARYSSTSGKLSVCAGAGAVGVGNMMNGIADAMRAKAPMLIIAGYINRWQMGKGAIQELDGAQMVQPVTKYSVTVLDEEDVMTELDKAVRIALTPPCGPVYISIPIDIQRSDFHGMLPTPANVQELRQIDVSQELVQQAAELLNRHRNGLIMVGRGGRGFSTEIMELSEKLQWPIITTPAGKGVIPTDFSLNLGNYGFSSTDSASEYVNSDQPSCVLILGTSLGEASTCNFNDVLTKGRTVIHIDQDKRELGKVFKTDLSIHGDMKDVLPWLISNGHTASTKYARKLPLNETYEKNHTGLSLRLFLENLKDAMPSNMRYVCDIGEFTNFVLKYLEIPSGGDFEINLDYGAMGSAIGGASGMYVADPTRPVAVIAGDGCFFMNGMEILTSKEYRIPVVYIIINNAMLSYVDRGQKYLFNRTIPDYKQERISIADMMRIAGIPAISINQLEDVSLISEFIRKASGPSIIEVNTDGSEPAPILDRLKALVK